jgi:hypothetical protein
METHKDFVEDEEGQCHILKVQLVYKEIESTVLQHHE